MIIHIRTLEKASQVPLVTLGLSENVLEGFGETSYLWTFYNPTDLR